MGRTIIFRGGSSIQLNTTELLVKVRGDGNLAIGNIVKDAERRLKEAMAGPRSGRRYRIGKIKRRKTARGQANAAKKQRFHIASAPGEPPAIRTNRLRGSIRSGVRNTPAGVEGVVGTNVIYAVFLETGTSRMAARPIWGRVLKESTDEIVAFFKGVSG